MLNTINSRQNHITLCNATQLAVDAITKTIVNVDSGSGTGVSKVAIADMVAANFKNKLFTGDK